MKLTVLKWFCDFLISLCGKIIETLFRITLLLTPLFVFLIILQNRSKASKVSNISVYTNDESVWQHIFPGFMLVAVDPGILKKEFNKRKKEIQNWIESNKYLLAMTFVSVIVMILLLINRKLGL